VNVRSRAYFEANTKTIIAGSVTGTVGGKQFIFLDQGTIVGGDIYTTGADQIWLFNSTALRAVNLVGTKSVVNICGMTIRDEVNVQDGFRDVLVGSNDPTTDCAGNLILREDVEIKDNDVDKEVTVQSNRLLDGDLEVVGNTGDGPKVVQDNVGTPDEALVCFGNSDPFTGTPNAGFGTATGQCSGI
jgi:hypothetical protein